MTPTQFALTLYALCGLSTLGACILLGGYPRDWGWRGWCAYTIAAFAILTCWPVPFAIALWVAADLKPAGKRWRAP